MNTMQTSALWQAQRFIGMKEVPGSGDNDAIMAMLKLDNDWPQNDETPWCSAFVNYIAWLLRLPRSKSLMARSWLQVGTSVWNAEYLQPHPGFDVVILARGKKPYPPAHVIDAPGHVGFLLSFDVVRSGSDGNEKPQDRVLIVGGNQGNKVSVGSYPLSRVLGIRRLSPGATCDPSF